MPEGKEIPTAVEFGVMTLDGDGKIRLPHMASSINDKLDYSSILLFFGTSLGRVITFKVLPASNGTYSVAFAGVISLGDQIISISPINADSGFPAYATPSAVGSLKAGNRINGVLVVTTTTGIHAFKPASARGAHKTFDHFLCDSAAMTNFRDRGIALVGLFGDGHARAYSIPALKEIGSAKISHVLDVKRFRDAIVTPTGDILGWTGPSELALLNVWGTGQSLHVSQDRLFNPSAPIPPRPTISNLQWISGTQYITPSDMDVLIGGPDRPPSKRMLAEMREADSAARAAAAARSGRPPPPPGPNGEQEGYWAYMQRQVQERTERLGGMDDHMGKLEASSTGWANDVGKFVQKQKRQMVLGAIGSKLGF